MNDKSLPAMAIPLRTHFPTLPEIRSPQEYAFLTLVEQIKKFEVETDEGEVVGAMLASFGHSVTLHIQTISRAGQFFCIEGLTENGNKATLLQHYTQASFLLTKLPIQPTEVKRPIGFLAE